MVSVRRKGNMNFKRVFKKLLAIVLWFWVGDEVLRSVVNAININNSVFEKAFDFLGVNGDGSFQSNGIVAIIGIVAVASLVLEFVEIEM